VVEAGRPCRGSVLAQISRPVAELAAAVRGRVDVQNFGPSSQMGRAAPIAGAWRRHQIIDQRNRRGAGRHAKPGKPRTVRIASIDTDEPQGNRNSKPSTEDRASFIGVPGRLALAICTDATAKSSVIIPEQKVAISSKERTGFARDPTQIPQQASEGRMGRPKKPLATQALCSDVLTIGSPHTIVPRKRNDIVLQRIR